MSAPSNPAPRGDPIPRAGVIAWPVRHSLSPRIHGFWLKRHGLAGSYEPLAVPLAIFEPYLRCLLSEGYAGANVSLPHKLSALGLCDRLSERAKRIGAVNTLVFRDGTIEGDNTDGFGFLENLAQSAPAAWRAADGPAVLLGAGGAARAVVAALLDAGVPSIRLVNRTLARAEELAEAFGAAVEPLDWTGAAAALEGANVLVNSTSLGLEGQPPLDLDLAALPPGALVTDIVYAPLETPLLRAAKARGNPVVDGLGMLLHQARPGFEAWFGVAPEVDAELRAAVLAPKTLP